MALFAFATIRSCCTKAAAQASTGCGSEVTVSQANRLWESFTAQGPTELSRLPSRYLSVPAYPILLSRTSRPTCLYHTRGLETLSCFDIWLATFHIVEMLYDTPFPTEPQNDLVPTQTERNTEIRTRYEHAEAVVDLAREYGISEQRISQIVHGRRS